MCWFKHKAGTGRDAGGFVALLWLDKDSGAWGVLDAARQSISALVEAVELMGLMRKAR